MVQTGTPTPASIARRSRQNTIRLVNKANGGFVFYPPNHHAITIESARPELRRAIKAIGPMPKARRQAARRAKKARF